MVLRFSRRCRAGAEVQRQRGCARCRGVAKVQSRCGGGAEMDVQRRCRY